MKYLELRSSIPTNIFSYSDVLKYFPLENVKQIQIQMSRFAGRKLITKIKRGIYAFDDRQINELQLAHLLYFPSYISLETALHYYGIIPDIPQQITSVTPVTTKKIKAIKLRYSYTKIRSSLFWGFSSVDFPIAEPEKTLLDYFYIRKVRSVVDLRLNLQPINITIYNQYKSYYPSWVQKIRI